jgi:hypothetical protein
VHIARSDERNPGLLGEGEPLRQKGFVVGAAVERGEEVEAGGEDVAQRMEKSREWGVGSGE